MTYFEDGTPYRFLPNEDQALNVGWLDGSREFPHGPVPAEFVAVLSRRCRDTVLHTRGWHYCNLCVPDDDRRSPSDFVKTVVHRDDGDLILGRAEIRVAGLDGVVFAAPDMVIHYVVDHGYRQPEEFIDPLAVRVTPATETGCAHDDVVIF